jgi:nucleotide-binding universal stress UspA family protein
MRKDIIIPVDFSETSLNAARYAADMLSSRNNAHITLYNMFKEEEEGDTAMQYLETLKTEFVQKGAKNIECIAELGDNLIDCLGRLAHQKNAELVIMGISEKDEWKQMFFGSNTLKMAEQNICPVMIIPPNSNYKGITNIALTSDFKDVNNATPVLAIKTVLEMFNAKLHIVNVDSNHYVALSEQYLIEKANMQKLFAGFSPEFYFIGTTNFEETITQFAVDRDIDLIIIIPKNHTFLDHLFGVSHTKKLAFQSPVPLLAAHQ